MQMKYENSVACKSCAWNSILNHAELRKLANELVSMYLLLRSPHCTDRRYCSLVVTMETRDRVISTAVLQNRSRIGG
jgi:hypothetical protein